MLRNSEEFTPELPSVLNLSKHVLIMSSNDKMPES